MTLRTPGALGPRSCAARHSPRDLVQPMPALLASHRAAHIPAQSLQPRVAVSSVCVLKVNSVLFFHCRFQLLIKNWKQTLTILEHSNKSFFNENGTVHWE